MLKAGIVGIENSHAEEIIKYLNRHRPATVPVRISALVAGDHDHTARLAELGSIDTIVASAGDLHGVVDALIVTSRDGALHRELAVPFLERGTPVWVDKPLAASVDDARAILGAAAGTLLTSSSALRWVPSTVAFAQQLRGIADLQVLTVTGPADPNSEHSGIFFYGIHIADIAQRLLPGPPQDIDVRQGDGCVIARYRVDSVLVTLQFITPDEGGRVPFSVQALGRHESIGQEIELGHDYVEPGIDAFAHMLISQQRPISEEQMLAPIEVLSTVSQFIANRSSR